MKDILEQIAEDPASGDTALLQRLFGLLRPRYSDDVEAAAMRLEALAELLEAQPSHADALRERLINMLNQRRPFRLLIDAGILSERGFRLELGRRIRYKLLPPAPNSDSLRDWLDGLLRPGDRQWIAGMDQSLWVRLLAALHFEKLSPEGYDRLQDTITTAIRSLSHRIASGGLNPELLRLDPSLDAHASPFLSQYEEISCFLNRCQEYGVSSDDDAAHALVLLEQCEEALDRVRRRAHVAGISVELTYVSTRLGQEIGRLKQLLHMMEDRPLADKLTTLAGLIVELLSVSESRHDVRALLRTTTGRLANRISQHVAHAGGHYVAENRKELWAIFRAAAGAGPIIAIMALIKILLMSAGMAPLTQTFFVGLNYALGFVVIYMLHFTVATKQPAMTATFMVNTLTRIRGSSTDKRMLGCFIGRVFKSQMMSILGNLLLAFATAVALSYGAAWLLDWHPVSPDEALHLIEELDPFGSLALFYAGVAGIGLFLSGIVSGYYDNKAVYERIAERLARLRGPQRLVGGRIWKRVADYIGDHLGGIAGNVFFGFYLGIVGALGFLTGLPLDIRHIAFSSANFGYAWQALDFALTPKVFLLTTAGVLLIGFMNLMVSFGLAFYVALRAINIPPLAARRQLGRALLGLLVAPVRLIVQRGDLCSEAAAEKVANVQESASK
ncbi:hypothetical protein [Thermithiobacillus plumbiphilus]|uniref:Recombinase n=1 Tax=Thermithiobacillus plumbiphilus TaxID=1729899 RepID=A0ABU9D6A7_9PROT